MKINTFSNPVFKIISSFIVVRFLLTLYRAIYISRMDWTPSPTPPLPIFKLRHPNWCLLISYGNIWYNIDIGAIDSKVDQRSPILVSMVKVKPHECTLFVFFDKSFVLLKLAAKAQIGPEKLKLLWVLIVGIPLEPPIDNETSII